MIQEVTSFINRVNAPKNIILYAQLQRIKFHDTYCIMTKVSWYVSWQEIVVSWQPCFLVHVVCDNDDYYTYCECYQDVINMHTRALDCYLLRVTGNIDIHILKWVLHDDWHLHQFLMNYSQCIPSSLPSSLTASYHGYKHVSVKSQICNKP